VQRYSWIESAVSPVALASGLKSLLLDQSVRLEMKSALTSLDRPDAAEQIVRHILKQLGCVEGIDDSDQVSTRALQGKHGSNESQQLTHSPSLS
jgi:hypothetical protein